MLRTHVWFAALVLVLALSACDSLTGAGSRSPDVDRAAIGEAIELVLVHPRALDARLATDLGSRGKDPYYGFGRVHSGY